MAMRTWCVMLAAALAAGCGSTRMFEAVPPGLDRTAVPGVALTMNAVHFRFIPDTIRVKEGTLLTLRITATDGTHGFSLGAFGVDERLEEGVPREIQLYASKKGVYPFSCSHFCGIGHFGMDGVLIVE